MCQMRVTEVNLIPRRGYLMELQPICEDHHDSTDPEKAALFPTPPLTHGCVCSGPVYLEWTVCITALAFVIEASEVKGANGVGVHAKTIQPSICQYVRCEAGCV